MQEEDQGDLRVDGDGENRGDDYPEEESKMTQRHRSQIDNSGPAEGCEELGGGEKGGERKLLIYY